MKKRVSVLGSTGSIGKSALEVIGAYPGRFEVVGLAAGANLELLEEQCRRFKPRTASLKDEVLAEKLRKRLSGIPIQINCAEEGLTSVATAPDLDLLVSAVVGAAGLRPTLAAIREGTDIALANKEIVVMAGEILVAEAAAAGVKILPVDSEHSAIFQCLQGVNPADVKRLILTASGGPLAKLSLTELQQVTKKQALSHPTWQMGKKISVDSATLMNKGLEVLEAHWFFGQPIDKIDVLIHPQSIIHSMVEMRDGSVMAQLGIPDMRLPILYALSYPERWDGVLPPLDLTRVGSLTFSQPDLERFPCLGYAYEAAKAGGTMPAVLNAANEVAVGAFLKDEIALTDIPYLARCAMEQHQPKPLLTVDDAYEADQWARSIAQELLVTPH